jgi:hypothetical protein
MNAWRISVTKTDGETCEYTVTPKTIVAFERHFKTGLAAAFANEQKMEHAYWLAWDAERSSGQVVPLFDKWLDDVSSVDIAVDNGPLDATP